MADERITMAHGAGGKMSQQLMQEVILPEFANPYLNELHDGASVTMSGRVAFTTDSYVVQPLFFNGGNIGKLAVCGTVNDLSMTGAVPRYISVGMILEEGFLIEDLRKIAHTMREMADEAGIAIVTGDTKVVERGKADGIFINTAGIGDIIPGTSISPHHVKPGMKVLLSGYIGDPTRGGVAAVLNEIAEASHCGVLIDEEALPIREEVRGVCDILGFDPLYLANEGKCIAFVPAEEADKVLAVMRENPYGKDACLIGEVTAEAPGQVGLRTAIGGIRIVDMPLGNLVPRIC